MRGNGLIHEVKENIKLGTQESGEVETKRQRNQV